MEAPGGTLSSWLTLLGIAAPLITLSGTALAYVIKLYQDKAARRRSEFFELMQFIDSDKPIATKMAAVYQLRNYKEHKDFVIRFCETQRNNIVGNGAHFLIQELDESKKFMEGL